MENGASPEVVAKEAEAALADLAARDLTGLTDAEVEAHAVATADLLRLAEAAHVAALARLDTLRGLGTLRRPLRRPLHRLEGPSAAAAGQGPAALRPPAP